MLGIIRGGGEIWVLKMAEHLEEMGANILVGGDLGCSDRLREYTYNHSREVGHKTKSYQNGPKYRFDLSR